MENKLKRCRNYNVITNCEFLDDDLFSQKLVEYYKKTIETSNCSDDDCIDKLTKYDCVMNKYIEDYNFSKKLKSSIDIASIVNCKADISLAVLEYLTTFFEQYEEEAVIVNTRWI